MKLKKRILACAAAGVLLVQQLLAVQASDINSIQQQIDQNQNALNKVNSQLDEYEAEREEYQSYLDDQKSEMMNLMKDIAYYEEAVAAKEVSIEEAVQELDAAELQRQVQYEAMMVRIQYMYEGGGSNSYLLMLLTSQDLGELLNRADYVDSLYSYDSSLLSDYEALVSDIAAMKETLENEKAELVKQQQALDEHKIELERVMAELEDTISDYDILVADAQKQAKAYKAEISKGQKQIAEIKRKEEEARKKAEEAERRKAEEAAKKNNASVGTSANAGASTGTAASGGSVTQVSGSGTGAEIAQFGLNYVGYPYVYGGNSLTGGVDCSGFVSQVYAHFGYDLGVRSSYSMRSIGTGVSLSEAKAGDIICYSGHVAIYIGDGKIVHAKNSQYGIVVDPVYYSSNGAGPTVLAVRRIIN